MTRHENAAACSGSGVERLQLGHQSVLSISLPFRHDTALTSLKMSPTPQSTRCFCSCAATALEEKSGRHVRNCIPSRCHLPQKRLSKAFTADRSHASRPIPSDTTHTCHPAAFPLSDRLGTTYSCAVPLHDSETHHCPTTPAVQTPIHHTLHTPTYFDPKPHICSPSSACDDAGIMPNEFGNSWLGSSYGGTEHQNFAPIPRTLPPRPHRQLLRTSAQTQASLMPWSGNEGFSLQDRQCAQSTIQYPVQPAQNPTHHDPTLAPELSLDDSDFITMMEAPFRSRSAPDALPDTAFTTQSTMNDDQAASDGFVDMEALAGSEEWCHDLSHFSANPSYLMESSEDFQLDPDFELSDIDIEYSSTQRNASHCATSMSPFLPELPASTDSQFELLNGIQNFAGDFPPTSAHDCEAGPSFVPGYTAEYPDPGDFNTPCSPTPGLTSASTTPNRQHAARGEQRDTSTDARLLQLRQEGRSYKQIKDILGLEEAESTLRGRYRTLIKPKEARVRKPEWTCEAVSTHPFLGDGQTNPTTDSTPSR